VAICVAGDSERKKADQNDGNGERKPKSLSLLPLSQAHVRDHEDSPRKSIMANAAASLRELSGKKVTLRNRTKFVEPIYEPASPPRCFDKGRGPVGCRRNGRKFRQLTHWGYIVSGPN